MLWTCLPARLMPLRNTLIGLGLLQGIHWGAFQIQCLRLGLYVRFVAFKAMLLPSVNPLSKELRMPVLCKTSTQAHKTIPAQILTTLVGGITQISPTTTTTPFHPMPPNLNPLVFNTEPCTTHLPKNLLNQNSIWKVLYSAL